MGIEVGGLLGLIWLIIVVWAIVKVAKARLAGLPNCYGLSRYWCFPWWLIAWFLFGPKG
ncbi:hypothetical protein HAALTHF_19080n [Vreelandella aquamarina]|nr:hypothetical protein HAALTHF_19080n [Halomonas axialensis]